MEKSKEILRGQLKGREEIELLESVHRKVVHSTMQPGDTLDGEKISEVFKDRPIYKRSKRQILDSSTQQSTSKKSSFKFPEADSDGNCSCDEIDEILEKPVFNIVSAILDKLMELEVMSSQSSNQACTYWGVCGGCNTPQSCIQSENLRAVRKFKVVLKGRINEKVFTHS